MNDRTLRPDEEAFFRYSKGKLLTPAEQDAFYAGWRARADLAAEREKRLASAEDIHALADKLHEAGLYKASVHARSLAMELAEIE